MKKRLILFFLLLVTASVFAQTISQKGVAYQYNGKEERTPLGNVTISYDGNQRTTISGEQDGTFSLTLTGRKMGDRIGGVTIRKREMMVFNQQSVDEWSVRKEPLRLILCNADEFERQKENLIAIGKREAKKKYDRQVADLEKQLAEGKIMLQEKDSALDKAYEELERARTHMDEYADLFARIDESEVDTLAQQAIELFNLGEVERAIQKFEEGRYMEKLDNAIKNSRQADKLKAVAEQAKERATQDSLKAVQSLKAQIEAYKLNNEWEKAGELLKGLADKSGDVEEIVNYANFCQKQNMHNEAELYFNNALIIYRRLVQQNPQTYERGLADVLNNLALLYHSIRCYKESEIAYQEVLVIRRRLAQQNPLVYEPEVAKILNNIALLYTITRRYRESEMKYKESMEIFRRLVCQNPQVYKPNVAKTLINFANLFSYTGNFEECEVMYKEALEIYNHLMQQNIQISETDFAYALRSYASFCDSTNQFKECELTYQEALGIYRRLAQENPQAYEPDVASTFNKLAALYFKTQRFQESESMCLEALEILHRLAQQNPQAYELDLVITLGNLSFYKIFFKKYAESEQYGREGLSIDSTQHWIASNLAASLLFQGKYSEAEQIYRQYKSELKEGLLDDFNKFAEAGVIPKKYEADVEKIKKMLNEE